MLNKKFENDGNVNLSQLRKLGKIFIKIDKADLDIRLLNNCKLAIAKIILWEIQTKAQRNTKTQKRHYL